VTAAGADSLRAFDTWTVAGDKAVGHIALLDFSDPQTVKVQLFQQAQAASAVAKPAASVGASAKPSAS